MNHDEENAVSSLEIDNPIVNDSTTEKAFESIDAPTWREQLTIRAFVVSFILSILFTFIVMKLNLTTGIIPSLNVSAGLLGFFFVKSWTKLVERFWVTKPFARQENTVIQTCVVASSGIAFSIMMNIVSTASDLSQDFKTGYLTLASPRSMFVSQFIGRVNGCVISPSVFWIFYKAFPDLGSPASKYPSPFGTVYRNIAALGIDGVGSLPKNCLAFCIAFFLAAIVINFIKDNVEKRWFKYIPVPMAMAIPFYLGGYFAIDMCLGSLILFVWEYRNKADAKTYAPTVASGLICGDGIWTLPSSFLALAVVKPPICMNFVSASQAAAEGL